MTSPSLGGSHRDIHPRRRQRRQKTPRQGGGFWKYTPFQELPIDKIEQKAEKNEKLAVAKRWTGRRPIFLGNYKNRRDGAFASQEHTAVEIEKLSDLVLDRIFQSPISQQGKTAQWPCTRDVEHTRREFGVGEKFGIDFDLSGVGVLYYWNVGSDNVD
jgi:hypothetical protein